jgi:hypothetical protein
MNPSGAGSTLFHKNRPTDIGKQYTLLKVSKQAIRTEKRSEIWDTLRVSSRLKPAAFSESSGARNSKKSTAARFHSAV